MTIDETLYRATESLILPSKRAFFPIKIPNTHPQLRHYISTANPDLIYFATGCDVCSLQLSTRKGNLIASLPFEPRCLVAGYGWISLGGPENGSCAFIRIGEQNEGGEGSVNITSPAEVDALLPLDLDPTPRRHFDRPLAQPPPVTSSRPRRKPEVFVHELGGLIVNAVTVFRMPAGGKNLDPEDLCVLSNNDQTVKIFSLTQSRVLETLEHPVAINYALISPLGNILAVVGDEHRVYFYKKVKLPSLTAHGNLTLAMYQWKLISDPVLPSDPHRVDEYWFTIAFSPRGHLCAVASQAGIITVFDMDILEACENGEDAIICTFRSSRPGIPGAVRSLSFSPEPWDLLVWAEERGRVCVTDVRERFRPRQTLELNVHAADLERRDISDLLDPEIEFNPESRAIRAALEVVDDDGPTPAMVDYMEAAAERRRLRRQDRQTRALAQVATREASPHGLSERERQILSALRTSRQRVNEIDSMGPHSVNYRIPIGHPSRPTANHDADEPRLGTLREFIRDRNRAVERVIEHGTERNLNPRRRSSIVLSQGNTSAASSHPTTSTLAPSRPGATGASTLTVSPARLLSPGDPNAAVASSITIPDPWQTIEAALQASPGPSQPDAATRLRREREAAIEANFERRQAEELRLEADRLMRTRLGPRHHPVATEDMGYYQRYTDPDDVGTAGLGWGEDGRMLYVGTEEGILEYHVNIQQRKTFPDFSIR